MLVKIFGLDILNVYKRCFLEKNELYIMFKFMIGNKDFIWFLGFIGEYFFKFEDDSFFIFLYYLFK